MVVQHLTNSAVHPFHRILHILDPPIITSTPDLFTFSLYAQDSSQIHYTHTIRIVCHSSNWSVYLGSSVSHFSVYFASSKSSPCCLVYVCQCVGHRFAWWQVSNHQSYCEWCSCTFTASYTSRLQLWPISHSLWPAPWHLSWTRSVDVSKGTIVAEKRIFGQVQ